MLAGLEDRQAYMSEGRDLVLDGLRPVNDDNFHHIKQRRFARHLLVLLVLSSGIFLATFIYKRYPGNNIKNDITISAGNIAGETQANRIKENVDNTDSRIIPAAENDLLLHEQPVELKNITLKMDYDINDRSIKTMLPAEQVVEVTENKTDETKAVPTVEPSITAFNVDAIDNQGSDVNLEMNENSDYRVYELNNPYRVAIEFDKYLSLPAGLPRSFENGLVSKIRGHHIYNNKRTMVVFDMSEKAVVKDSEMNETGDGYELVVRITPAISGNESRKTDYALDMAVPAAAVENQASKPKNSKLSVTRNSSTPDQILARGLSDYQKGKIKDGLEQISQVLDIEPEHVQARSTLVNLLIERNDIPQAINILDQGIKLHPEKYDWRELKAKLLVKMNKHNDAIEALIKAGPEPGINPEYYAFLAALLQQQGRNEEAVGYYQKVVSARGDNGIWWMGLGISLERIGQAVRAESAYRKAVKDVSLAPDIRNYIKNRISIISGQ